MKQFWIVFALTMTASLILRLPAEPQTNDNFTYPITVGSLPYTNSQSVAGYTVVGDDPDIPCISDTGFNTAWYQYAPAEDQTVAIDTLGSNYDTVLAVWTGGRGALVHVACNDDYDYDNDIFQSRVAVNLSAGTTYHIEIASHDFNPSGTSLTLNIATTTPDPEINLKGNNWTIRNGDTTPSLADHTDFGGALLPDGTVARTFTIENLGAANLTLSGVPRVSLSGAHAADFSVTAEPSSPVTPGGSTTFSVTFDPSAAGVRSATVSIANNDGDENPYTFAIRGTGVTIIYSIYLPLVAR